MSHATLFGAIRAGDLAQVEALLADDPALAGARDEGGLSAVLMAAYHHQPAILAALLAHGPELNLYEAAAVGATARLAALLDADPGLVNSYAPDGFYALGLASFFGHAEAARLLLERGADVGQAAANSLKVMPLHAAVAGRHLAIAAALIAHGADVNAPQQDGFTPLAGARQNGQQAMIDLLIAHGADDAKR